MSQETILTDQSHSEPEEKIDLESDEKDNETTPAENGVETHAEEDLSDDKDDLSPPLSAELKRESTDDQESVRDGIAETDLSLTPVPAALKDPVEILINFLYTSHIDITQQNVDALRETAAKCEFVDVVTACDEFAKVLRDETEPMETDEEKDAASKQFRFRYSDPLLPTRMLEHLSSLREAKRYTDVVVVSDASKVRFEAHRAVLAAGSSFFKSSIAASCDAEHQVAEIDESVLESLLCFLYTGKIGLSQQSVRHLLHGSDVLQRKDLLEGCAEFLESSMTVQKCVEYRQMAIDYNLDKIKVGSNSTL